MLQHLKPITIQCHLAQASENTHIQSNIEQDTPNRVSCFFPSTRGVVEMLSEDGQVILLAATGHIRSFIAQRLNEDGQRTSRADLVPITSSINAYQTGSAFESDWIVHEIAKERDPSLYQKLNDQNQRALLFMNAKSGTWNACDTTTLTELIESQHVSVEHAHVIGPFLTKNVARQFGEALDDVYELCREPKQLAKAPDGQVCAYFDMDRCPGACAGHEPMSVYHDRFNEAIGTAKCGVSQTLKEIQFQLDEASKRMDFEEAQSHKRDFDRLKNITVDRIELINDIESARILCISPSVRKGWALLWGFDTQGLTPIVSVSDEYIEHHWKAARSMILNTLDQLNQVSLEALRTDDELEDWLHRYALLSRHWFIKPSKTRRRRVSVLDLSREGWEKQALKAMHQACVPVDHDSDADDEEHTHIQR